MGPRGCSGLVVPPTRSDTLCKTFCWLLYLRLVACLRGEEVGLSAWYGTANLSPTLQGSNDHRPY